MARYGKAAVKATKRIQRNRNKKDPLVAWKAACKQEYPDKKSARTKVCPRSTYLGLCEAGLVVGVEAGKYTRSPINKKRAVDAVRFLCSDSDLAFDKKIRCLIKDDNEIKNNNQLEVVLALLENDLINCNASANQQ